jgi:hypothetical protein
MPDSAASSTTATNTNLSIEIHSLNTHMKLGCSAACIGLAKSKFAPAAGIFVRLLYKHRQVASAKLPKYNAKCYRSLHERTRPDTDVSVASLLAHTRPKSA